MQTPLPQPQPVALHLALQTLTWLSSLSALNGLKSGSIPWRPGLKKAAESLQKNLEKVDLRELSAAVDAEARSRLIAFSEGVNRYGRHPREPRPPEPDVFWRDGATRVLDYGPQHTNKGDKNAMPVLVVPSLINRGYILDLTVQRSLMRYLASVGLRPFLVDWGMPGAEEKNFDLTSYICWRLEPIADEIFDATGQAPALLGYCMGGLLTLALAHRRPDRVAALAFLATPWDFHAGPKAPILMLEAMAPGINTMIDQLGALPVDVLQAMFSSLDPYLTANKFRRFSTLQEDSDKAREFIVLEDWLNDGVPLVGKVARECLMGWYLDNAPAKGTWKVDGEAVLPEAIKAPSLVIIPEDDHIVPPGSATALADAIPGATRKSLAAGHIGMVAGGRAKTILYKPLGQWLCKTLTEVN
ncbi:MAG: alpha/beta fold hydrolase [Proteobacteria bacterium]|nr:alpha/beta fold hydrolase [Pseudomonadota bacterium]